MKLIFLFSLLLLTTAVSYSQQTINEYNLAKNWPKEILKQASVDDDVNFMKPEEKEVIFIFNLARLDGSLFVKTILEPYLEAKNIKSDRNVKSLINTLDQQKQLPVFQADKLLYQLALDHASVSGKRGSTGHNGFDKRFNNAKKDFWSFAENLYYGQNNAMEIAASLLIDKGISDLGHRKNILNRELGYIGVSIQPHRSVYAYNCVMDFGGKR